MNRCGIILLAGLAIAVLAGPAGGATTGAADKHKARGDLNCDDFPNQAAAQNNLESNPSDPNGLDADNDGIACEENPCPCSTGGGGGGGGGGGAPPAPPPPPPDPVKTEKVCGKFVGISGSRVCLKKTTQGDKLKKVTDFRFRGLPAQCDNGAKPRVRGKRAKIDGDGKRFRTRRLSILGNFSSIEAKAVGKLKDGGKKVRGEVRVRFRNEADAACDTRARKFKAS
jgi:hypothetical protein